MVRRPIGGGGRLVLIAAMGLSVAGGIPRTSAISAADETSEVTPSAGEHSLWHLTLAAGGTTTTLDLDGFDLEGRTSSAARRVVLRPHPPFEADLPLLTIAEDKRGNRRPDLYDPRTRLLIDTALTWLEAESALDASWLVVGATGEARVHLPSLRLRSRIPVDYTCTQGEAGVRIVQVTLREPVSEGTNLKTELLSLDWRLVVGEDGRVTEANLSRETRRRAGSIEQRDPVEIGLRFESRTPLGRDAARAVIAEAEALDPIVRALLPGRPKKAVESARKALEDYRRDHPDGRLVAAADPLRDQLAARSEAILGGTPDERAQALVGKMAPDFELTDLDGKTVQLSSLRGTPVVLSFWGYT